MTVVKPDYREGTWWWHSVLVAEAAAVLRGRHDGRLRGTFARGLGVAAGVFLEQAAAVEELEVSKKATLAASL